MCPTTKPASPHSLSKKENPVAFSLGEEGLKWLGEYDISIEDLLMGKAGTKKETKLEKAQKLILELLTKRKVMCLEELEAELLAYGISSRTGRDARKQLENRLSYDWCQGRKTVALTTESRMTFAKNYFGIGSLYRNLCQPPMSEKLRIDDS